ncbi:MAG: hypothetical protein IPK26_08500 [Planctomycetes bacterium]|nr:hypothetical protein [Planctomycetota bacterium]
MALGVLRKGNPSLDADDTVAHGLVMDGVVGRLGPWVPPFFMPFGSWLLCSADGRSLLDASGLQGVVRYEPLSVRVADAGIRSDVDVRKATHLYDEEIVEGISLGCAVIECFAVRCVSIACTVHILGEDEDGVPLSRYEIDKVPGLDTMEFVAGFSRRHLFSERAFRWIDKLLPNWFRFDPVP